MDIKREQNDGEFERQEDRFRDRVTADGTSGYPAEPGRYHLYVSLACPWAHRTVIVRKLKQLEDIVGITVADPVRDERGWRFGGWGEIFKRSDRGVRVPERGLPGNRSDVRWACDRARAVGQEVTPDR